MTSDIGRSIIIVSPTHLVRVEAERRVLSSALGAALLLPRALRAERRYEGTFIEKQLWAGADGVLFFEVLGPVADPSHHDSVARDISAHLKHEYCEPCIVPSSSLSRDPSISSERLCFALGSCHYTSGIIDGTPRPYGAAPTPGPADKSYARLSERLRCAPVDERPQLLIMAGDQVYVDATAGLFDPSISDGRYRRPYEQLFSSIYVQDVVRQIPLCAMLDDHEIEDNWEQGDVTSLKLGVQSYRDYLRAGSLLDNPRFPGNGPHLWSSIRWSGFDFFFMDTRTERQKRTAANVSSRAIMSQQQLDAFAAWLDDGQTSGRPRFVVSPAILLPRRRTSQGTAGALLSDAWDGYPKSHGDLLDLVASKRATNLIFLSGDEHRCAVASGTSCEDRDITVRSIHASGMHAPFPFANSLAEEFATSESFATQSGRRWDVDSTFAPPGQGFALLDVWRDGTQWVVRVRFDLEPFGARGAAPPPVTFTL